MSLTGLAQLPDGSVAPDFVATDINGSEHHLYSYLDSGYQVILLFEATWNGPGWQYHSSETLRSLHEQFGPDGTNEIRVLMLESDDQTTLEDLTGTGSSTQGDWVTGTPYPIIDDAGPIFDAFECGYYPTIFTVCPDRQLTEAGQLGYEQFAELLEGPTCASEETLSVMFTVDMTPVTSVSEFGVHLAGSFQSWDPAATPMNDNGDGTWSVSLDLMPGTYEFKFINSKFWDGNEEFMSGTACSDGDNRSAYFDESNNTYTACFNQCPGEACESLVGGCTDASALNFTLDAIVDDGSCVYPPATPECASVCGPGTHWDMEQSLCLPTLSADLDLSGCVGMSDLLEMLAQFGACFVPEWSCGDVLNYHGYDYETVLVANDCWFAENLRTERYDNGDLIPSNVPDSALWTSQGAQTFYDMHLPYLEARGRLYNAFAMMDPRGLCPAGWHPASDDDFLTVEALVGLPPSLYDYDGEFGCDEGLAAMFKSEEGWDAGAEGTNALGLNFGATGYHSYGDWSGYGNFGNGTYWTSTSSDGFHFWRRQFASNDNCLRRSWDNPWVGMGVRCVQDSE
ncbi:MAG: FISUMP domain-containing protein [Flavobacteriales bacterium]